MSDVSGERQAMCEEALMEGATGTDIQSKGGSSWSALATEGDLDSGMHL